MAMRSAVAVTIALVVVVVLSYGLTTATAQGECSRASPCPNSAHCCSQFGFCGDTDPYCGKGCQAGPCTPPTPPGPPAGPGLGAILTRSLYEQLFPGHLGFYSYDALMEAAKLFPQFGTTGDANTRKREIAAYAAHVKHETGGQFVLISVP